MLEVMLAPGPPSTSLRLQANRIKLQVTKYVSVTISSNAIRGCVGAELKRWQTQQQTLRRQGRADTVLGRRVAYTACGT